MSCQFSAADVVLKVDDFAHRGNEWNVPVAPYSANDASPDEKIGDVGVGNGRAQTEEEREGRARTLLYCDPYSGRQTGQEGIRNYFIILS